MKSKKAIIDIIEKDLKEGTHPFNTYDQLIDMGYTNKEISEVALELIEIRRVH